MKTIARELSDLEDRNYAGNLHIFGISENTEKDANSFIEFIESWLSLILGLKFDKEIEIERAHRIPSGKQPNLTPGQPIRLRAPIFRPLRYHHTEAILTNMRKTQHVEWNGARITIAHDYSKETGGYKKGLLGTMTKSKRTQHLILLRGHSQYCILFKGKTMIFWSPADILAFLDTATQTEMSI
ncbi:hypothetical protein NDU88_001421 [Pleurodeles waltl]|uniref:Uncharacterized protein n=1 Tax=Pleurodeles waltl TaxID=8319 RepID=A0AAV7MMM4_PLEWA|nr:hypothetical protein NDU88_001421 [Pleurodeles waltl]